MADADKIIIEALRHFGCELNPDMVGIGQMTSKEAILSSLKCLQILGNFKDVSCSELPSRNADKYRLCGDIAQTVKGMGYSGDLGFQSFLYVTENDLRKIFSFLVGKLPREQDIGAADDVIIDPKTRLMNAVRSSVKEALNIPWVPWYCRKPESEGSREIADYRPVNFDFADEQGYQPGSQKIPLKGVPLIPSLIYSYSLAGAAVAKQEMLAAASDVNAVKNRRLERNMKQGIQAFSESYQTKGGEIQPSGSRRIERVEAERKVEVDEKEKAEEDEEDKDEKERDEQAEIEKLKDELQGLMETLAHAEREVAKLESKLEQAEPLVMNGKTELEAKKSDYEAAKRGFEFVPNASEKIQKLSTRSEAIESKVQSREDEWTLRKKAFMDRVEQLRVEWSNESGISASLKEELSELKERADAQEIERRTKSARLNRILATHRDRDPGGGRDAYTRRIFEIVANIKKQCEGIDKILADTRGLQKSINMLEGKLDRSFSTADELIFRDAKKDEKIRKAYKSLAALREAYDLLISTNRDIGVMKREILDLEDQVEQEKAKNVVAKLEGVKRDFAEMKAENAVLEAKLKS